MTGLDAPLPSPPAGASRRRAVALAALLLVTLLGALAGATIASVDIPGARITGWLPWTMLALIALLGLLTVTLLARWLADRTRLLALAQAMTSTSRTDWLTGIYNRRALSEQLARVAAHSRRHGEPVSVMIVELDTFTSVREQFGEPAADALLARVSDCMRDVLRADDVYGRWGVYEFLVILPTIDAVAVAIAAERLRAATRELRLREIGQGDGVEISVGTASGVHTTPEAMIAVAERDLKQAAAAKAAARASLARI